MTTTCFVFLEISTVNSFCRRNLSTCIDDSLIGSIWNGLYSIHPASYNALGLCSSVCFVWLEDAPRRLVHECDRRCWGNGRGAARHQKKGGWGKWYESIVVCIFIPSPIFIIANMRTTREYSRLSSLWSDNWMPVSWSQIRLKYLNRNNNTETSPDEEPNTLTQLTSSTDVDITMVIKIKVSTRQNSFNTLHHRF